MEETGCQFAEDIFKWIFLTANVSDLIKISLKFVPKGPIENKPALVQVITAIAWTSIEQEVWCHMASLDLNLN